MVTFPDGGEVDVAVVDSVYDPGGQFRENQSVGLQVKPPWVETKENYQPVNAEASCSHGLNVAEILVNYSVNAQYHFMTAVRSTGDVDDKEVLFALGTVLENKDRIDIVNISAGLYHAEDEDKDCTVRNPACSVCEMANSVIDAGIPIVAGAGKKGDDKGLCCPSTATDVIASGGAVAECTADVRSSGWQSDGSERPPNAVWIRHPDENGWPGNYCSQRGCYPGENCSDNRVISPWSNNPEPRDGKPNVLAPCVWPARDEERNAVLAAGTSYAVPIVTSAIANVTRSLDERGYAPTAPSVRASLEKSGNTVPDGEVPLLDGEAFAEHLGEKFDLEYNDDTDRNDDLHRII